jgi:hypothetical protein
MDSTTASASIATEDRDSMVDPFLVEALSNPRHRLTILRMELDIQKFLQNSDHLQFEFQHFPTSYLRLAAHRVAQHYGLVTMVQDIGLDGTGNRILVRKQGESRSPFICLSEIPAKHLESDKPEHVKITIRPRPNKGSGNGSNENGMKRSAVRSVEERTEDYEKARARIFSTPSNPGSGNATPQVSTEENESWRSSMIDPEMNIGDGVTQSRVAIFRDREKDRIDPDYDRSYESRRYVRSLPANQNFGSAPFNGQNIQLPFVPQYDGGYPQLVQMARSQASPSYMPPNMNPYCAMGLNQMPRNAAYVQWPSSTMMYAQSYDQFRQAVFQVPYHQQPLSFDYAQSD